MLKDGKVDVVFWDRPGATTTLEEGSALQLGLNLSQHP